MKWFTTAIIFLAFNTNNVLSPKSSKWLISSSIHCKQKDSLSTEKYKKAPCDWMCAFTIQHHIKEEMTWAGGALQNLPTRFGAWLDNHNQSRATPLQALPFLQAEADDSGNGNVCFWWDFTIATHGCQVFKTVRKDKPEGWETFLW